MEVFDFLVFGSREEPAASLENGLGRNFSRFTSRLSRNMDRDQDDFGGRMRKRDIARNMARESAIGCGTHFLLAMAGTIFIGGAAV
jgi:hypothetical protein